MLLIYFISLLWTQTLNSFWTVPTVTNTWLRSHQLIRVVFLKIMQLSLTNDRREFAGLDQWEAITGWWVTLTVTLKTLIITVHITFVMPHSSSHRLVHHSPDIALSISYKYRIVHSYYNPSDWNPTSEVVGFYKEIHQDWYFDTSTSLQWTIMFIFHFN